MSKLDILMLIANIVFLITCIALLFVNPWFLVPLAALTFLANNTMASIKKITGTEK